MSRPRNSTWKKTDRGEGNFFQKTQEQKLKGSLLSSQTEIWLKVLTAC